MPLYKEFSATNYKVAIWKIEESYEELNKILRLSTADQIKINSFKLESRKKEWITSRLLLKHLLNEYPTVLYRENGHPYLKNSNYKISISHTKGFVSVIVSNKFDPGIDIEYPSERVNKITKRFVSPDENSFITEDQATDYHTLIWCTKEAMFKIINREGVIFNEQLRTEPFSIHEEGEIYCCYTKQSHSERIEFHFHINEYFYVVYRTN